MSSVPAQHGFLWLRQGIQLFSRRPGEFISLMLAYLMLLLPLMMMPYIGVVLYSLLIPGLYVAVMQACRQVERGESIWSQQLLQSLTMPGLRPQLKLGLLWVTSNLLGMLVLYLLLGNADDSQQIAEVLAKRGSTEAQQMVGELMMAFSCAVLVQIPFMMALWFAPILVGWHQMPPGKAIFYSFFAVWHAIRAFIILGLGMVALFFSFAIIAQIISAILGGIFGSTLVSVITMLGLQLLTLAIFYCSLYCSYEYTFGGKSDWRAEP